MMTFVRWRVHALRAVCLVVLVFVVLPLAAIQVHQYLFRWRAERLVADMHRIRLYQSTWGDAQKLMSRWGTWGKYEGTCEERDCKYYIELASIGDPSGTWRIWLADHHAFQIYSFFGGRYSRVVASFTVHKGSIWRESLGVAVSAQKGGRRVKPDDFALTLIVDTKSRQRLRTSPDGDWWIMGDDDQLATHPYYKEGRPGGCKISCEEAVVTYSTHTPPAEIERLSQFNLSCLTRFNPCMELEQVLPAARDWHLYKDEEVDLRRQNDDAQKPCAIPLWALARDNRYVVAVKAVSTSKKMLEQMITGLKYEQSEVEIKEAIKGVLPWPVSSVVMAHPFPGIADGDGLHQQAAEHLQPGKAYILLPVGGDRRDRVLRKDLPMSLDQCGVWEDTAENRRSLVEGFAQNDTLQDSFSN